MINVNKFRKTQTVVSIIIFTIVFFLFWDITDFKLSEIQLSYWGVYSKIGWIWNFILSLLSISIYINVSYYIKNHTRLHFKKFLQIIFLITSLFLFLTGVVNMNHMIHDVTAYLYFFSYPLVIFVLSHLNRKHLKYKEWITHMIFSIIMIVLPLILIKFFVGKAIPEIAHSLLVIGWNLWLLKEEEVL